MRGSVKLLLVEDDEDDFLITSEVLEEIRDLDIELKWVESYQLGLSYLAHGGIDVCLVDYRIGARTGLEFLDAAKQRGIDCPMILLTGVGQRDIDVAAMEHGASDYLDKSGLSAELVERSIRYSMAHAAALRTLAEQTSFLETTLEHVGAGIAALDRQGRVATSNRQFEETLPAIGIGADDDSASNGFSSVGELVEVLRADPSHRIEMRGGDGRTYELRLNEAPQGGSVIFALDVTAQHLLQNNILKAKADAEAASRAKSSFLANVSHELRTPLNSIIGFSEVILAEAAGSDPLECARHINESGTHLLSVINAVLDYSKLEAGQHTFDDAEIFDMDCIVRFAIRQVTTLADSNGIALEQVIDPALDSVRADEMAVRRILVNLVNNAVKFSEPGGRVTVTVSIRPDGRLDLAVADRGIGMDPHKAELAFVPFFQLHDTLDRSYEGTGLGLPIVKSLAELHGGEVAVETAPGEGTTMHVILPADRVTLAAPANACRAGEAGQAGAVREAGG